MGEWERGKGRERVGEWERQGEWVRVGEGARSCWCESGRGSGGVRRGVESEERDRR